MTKSLKIIRMMFVHCYHLKDWIKNDPENNILKGNVESCSHSSLSLKICGDICNGLKHLRLDKPKSGNGAKIQGSDISLTLGGGPPKISVKYIIEVEGEKYDAFTIASEAVTKWQAFLNGYLLH